MYLVCTPRENPSRNPIFSEATALSNNPQISIHTVSSLCLGLILHISQAFAILFYPAVWCWTGAEVLTVFLPHPLPAEVKKRESKKRSDKDKDDFWGDSARKHVKGGQLQQSLCIHLPQNNTLPPSFLSPLIFPSPCLPLPWEPPLPPASSSSSLTSYAEMHVEW